jgi:hypothetical protein
MNTEKRPIRTTILYGLVWGILFVLTGIFFRYTLSWPHLFRLMIFLCLAGYAWLLAGWSEKGRFAILFPLSFLFLLLFCRIPSNTFLLLFLWMLSWIRSGICFPETPGKAMGIEAILCIGGGALVASFTPQSTPALALGIWLFFLVQSFYFMIMGDGIETDMENPEVDLFDQARMRAERIIS